MDDRDESRQRERERERERERVREIRAVSPTMIMRRYRANGVW